MNRIGIIGAMESEVSCLKNEMEQVTVTTRASMEFYEGTLRGKNVVVVRSGIGKVNAGICAQILVDLFKVEGIINTGIAGSLNTDIQIGDIVLSTEVVQHDVDATVFGCEKGHLPQMETGIFEADAHLRELAEQACKEVNPDIQVFKGRIASGDQFICERDVKDRIRDTFGAFAVEMEGAAVGQAAWLNKTPFLIIRAISDNADDSTGMEYSTFEKLAAEHSVRLTEKLIESL